MKTSSANTPEREERLVVDVKKIARAVRDELEMRGWLKPPVHDLRVRLDIEDVLRRELKGWVDGDQLAAAERRAEQAALTAELIAEDARRWEQAYEQAEREREEALAELATKKAQYKAIIDDVFSDMECLPKCDSYAHEEDCPSTNAAVAFRQLRARLSRLTSPERLREIAEEIIDLLIWRGTNEPLDDTLAILLAHFTKKEGE